MWLRGGWLPWAGRDLGRPHTQHVLFVRTHVNMRAYVCVIYVHCSMVRLVGLSVCLSVRRFVCLSADDMRLASQGSTVVISWFSLETVALA